jgi:hypothetical protein
MRRIGGFLGPFENRQLRIAALNRDPVRWIVALCAANLTLVICPNHRPASTSKLNPVTALADLPKPAGCQWAKFLKPGKAEKANS